mmetsp:Transcript_6632/g.20648  ORF Transcript_6632/g.20648 Transcript_6632/m.20648 type:complete len:239 (-) Transcript_6632:2063-2779(-)
MADKSPFFFSELVKNDAARWQHSKQYLDAMKSDSAKNLMSRKSDDDALLSSSLSPTSSSFNFFHSFTTKGIKISTVSPKAEADSTTASTTEILLFLLFEEDDELSSSQDGSSGNSETSDLASIFNADIFVRTSLLAMLVLLPIWDNICETVRIHSADPNSSFSNLIIIDVIDETERSSMSSICLVKIWSFKITPLRTIWCSHKSEDSRMAKGNRNSINRTMSGTRVNQSLSRPHSSFN